VPDKALSPPPSPSASSPKPPELIELEALQKQVEALRGVAVMLPTEANVRRYMELEAAVVRRASFFADVAQRVAWAHPELDMTLEGRPVNAQAIEVFDREQGKARTLAVADLGREHVLLFFFRSDCPYCHAFAPVLAQFEKVHGIKVVAISLDGAGLAEFPDFRGDNGIARTLKVGQVPALFLAQPASGQIVPVGVGAMSESQLLERLAASVAPMPAEARRVEAALQAVAGERSAASFVATSGSMSGVGDR
jgi:conjugal transfer pilus assembly protein TraF